MTARFLFSPVDDRTAAAFRITLAISMLAELGTSWPDICDMWAQEGLLPLLHGAASSVLTLHRVDCMGSTALHLMHGLFSLALLVGTWPRAFAFSAYALQFSLLKRNPYIVTGECTLRCALLLWASLLPNLGSRWSIDLGSNGDARDDVSASRLPASLAPLGLKLQLALFYLTLAIIKVREGRRTDAAGEFDVGRGQSPWLEGAAVAEALACFEYQRPLGRVLLQHPAVCQILTWLTLALEGAVPLLLVLGGAMRLALLLSVVGMHIALHLCMALGHFSLVRCAGLSVFIPAKAWELVDRLIGGGVRVLQASQPPELSRGHGTSKTEQLQQGVSMAASAAVLLLLLAVSQESLDLGLPFLADYADGNPTSSGWAALLLERAASSGRAIGLPGLANMSASPPYEVRVA